MYVYLQTQETSRLDIIITIIPRSRSQECYAALSLVLNELTDSFCDHVLFLNAFCSNCVYDRICALKALRS